MRYGTYTSDDGHITCALWISDDTFTVMGFSPAAIDTPRKVHGLELRKIRFVNARGNSIALPFPTTVVPFGFQPVTVRGDPSFFATEVIAEVNKAESV